MSWNAGQLAREIAEQKRRAEARGTSTCDPLTLWLTADAIDRILADGGYVDDPALYLAHLNVLLTEHTSIVIGLGQSVGTTCEGLEPRVITALDRHHRQSDREIVRQLHPDIAHWYADEVAGGTLFDAEFKKATMWTAGDGSGGGIWKLVVSALIMFTDPEARADAAVTHESRAVEVPRRRGTPRHTTPVQVIDVRRSRGGGAGTGSGERRNIEHDHRWVTRGHWRNQACGKGWSQRRRVWIAEHICGPEDKPLRRDQRVYRIA